jgi:hypothetical protein
MRLGKFRQDRYRVVADSKDSNSVTREVRERALQLHELRFAERSPTRTAMKEHDRAPPGACLMQINSVAVLIRQ